MQRLINLRDSINHLSVQLILMNKTVCDTIEVYSNPSDSPDIDLQLVNVLVEKIGLHNEEVAKALMHFTSALEGMVRRDEQDSDI